MATIGGMTVSALESVATSEGPGEPEVEGRDMEGGRGEERFNLAANFGCNGTMVVVLGSPTRVEASDGAGATTVESVESWAFGSSGDFENVVEGG